MAQALTTSILRLVDANRAPVGVGFLIGDNLAVTCAHVVLSALGLPSSPKAPKEAVRIDFPLLGLKIELLARIIFWDQEADIAGLELEGQIPSGARPVRLTRANDLWGHSFRAFGFPSGLDNGVWASGRILAQEAGGWFQVEDIKATGYSVQPGFSGGPAWDEQLQGVIGMVAAADTRPDIKTAFCIPAEKLISIWPALGSQAIAPNPYRGLNAFREQDAPMFFGRDVFANKLLAAVQRQPLVAVIGSSGSGKSSVVFAGLVPRVRKLMNWLVLDFRPGTHPFESLTGVLMPVLEPQMSETDRLLESRKMTEGFLQGDLHLMPVIARILKKDDAWQRLLIVVDQFEELYSPAHEESIRQRFIDTLLECVRESTNLCLVLTLRADFMSQALAYRPLSDALQDADLKLGPMNLEELRQVIEEPARVRKVAFQKGLAERILDDVGIRPGGLPLLEFALTLLWEQQVDGELTHEAYSNIGGVEGALAHYADQVLEDLSTEELEQIRRVFIQLVRPGTGTEDTRRQALRAEMGDKQWRLVERLADARLVVTDRAPEGGESAEVVHEALIHNWNQLRAWMAANHEFRAWQERLRGAMTQWEENGRDNGALLRGAPLVEAIAWLEQRGEEISEKEQEFVRASVDLREKEQHRDRVRRLSIVGSLSLASILVAIAITLAASGQWNRLIFRPFPLEGVTIAGGEFLMGNTAADPLADPNQLPQHNVYIDAFEIMKYEVTNREYWQCVRSGVCRRPSTSRIHESEYAAHPVVYVNWDDAQTFCNWTGWRLPTEAEWEKAARGGLEGERYPWGSDTSECSLVNYRHEGVRCINDTTPVGNYPPNNFGLYDMAGNVWEWVSDYYDEQYYTFSPSENPTGPGEGFYRDRIIRGGGWDSDEKNILVAFRRNQNPDNWSIIIGFRCARTP